MTAAESAPLLAGPVLLPLLGAPCAVCAHAARYVDGDRRVIHTDLRLRPCALPPVPAVPPPTDIEVSA